MCKLTRENIHLIRVPWKRRMTMMALLLWNWPSTLLSSLAVMVFMLWYGGLARYFMLAYMGYILIIDDAPERAGRKWMIGGVRLWFRNLWIWRYVRDFFPVGLVKTADLPEKNVYIFGYHPHGVLGEGAFINFGTNATQFHEKFPGVDIRILTLGSNLLTPFHREWAMMHGCGVASRKCVNHCLSNGASVAIVLGGAAEALDSKPGGSYELTLLKRKGFVRLALMNGAHLVPTMSFGENDIYDQVANPPGSRLRRCQEWFKATLGVAPPIILGRGVFNLDWGLLPRRRPIVTVVGAPIPVEKVAKPTEGQVSALHRKYVEALNALFDAHKAKYGGKTLVFKG